ncbi:MULTISPECIES: RNA-binding S4 domain-containing protein [unclassified Mesorhizobium]|uniref:RNA-binding S4 domain-containing protein n=1 Tax=unclassified Mesorhizobium TaxID=325217 RepID=UPI000BAE722B|nr:MULTISPECIES: RNA-binding S4 domain-containing protein [unclassified Mesorhizobium]TGT63798.1 RNA-binding S4 domain-containing protein [Mesorhizobium sp. M00.F.Ca.ET.170.01.1.1]AZO11125.1 RNA-binding S4 domain-containing protein [Mesorhizobium sp. M3A.F.Ca.ET.080.04.2.1]PBB88590.1 RNA-binding protein [Mesorhizobium sp. WSM3876]RWB76472.1 MAG: RNA-binding S4 domain-containing protein [Mesorhizobium sp.]RWB92354.1 MAG: RNA-binding S4 domain-containing protein [Mesorhizobium sp.]
MVGEGRQRIDKWLFFSRAVKSRSLAAKIVVAGRVRINRDKAAQASDLVKPGDVLTITLEGRILVWKVLGPGTRRGPAEEARLLYEDMSPPPTPKGEAVPDAIPALREAGSGRPTKRERRQTDRLLGED